MRGFVFAISALFLFSALLLYSAFYAGNVHDREIDLKRSYAVIKAGAIVEDVEDTLNDLLGTEVDVNRGSSYTTIEITDSLPSGIAKEKLSGFETFIETEYDEKQNTTVILDLLQLTDGLTELKFNNGLQYDYNYGIVNYVQFGDHGDGSGVLAYDINVSVNDTFFSTGAWAWDSGGDINVNIDFRDNDGNSVTQSGKLDSSLLNRYDLNFSGDGSNYVAIHVGQIGADGRSILIRESLADEDTVAAITIKALLPAESGDLVCYYNADLNVLGNDVNVGRKPELCRG